MSKTLSTLRSMLRNKANQTQTSGDVVWANSEVDDYIRAGVRAVIDKGRVELLGSAFKEGSVTPSLGKVTKPSDYYRFVSAVCNSVIIPELLPYEFVKVIEENAITESTSSYIRLYDYSGSQMAIFPTTTTTDVSLQYVAEFVDSSLENDSDTSPLTSVGDEYAVEYAYGLMMQSKGYQPEFGDRIMQRVLKTIS